MPSQLKSLKFKLHCNQPQIMTFLLCMHRMAKDTAETNIVPLLPTEIIFNIAEFLDTYISDLTKQINVCVETLDYTPNELQEHLWAGLNRIRMEDDIWKSIIHAEWEYGDTLTITELKKKTEFNCNEYLSWPTNYVFYFIMCIAR